jgi:hypothetical protein
MVKKDFVRALNALLQKGTVVCVFRDHDYLPYFRLSERNLAPGKEALESQSGESTSHSSDPSLFKTAYDVVGKGRSFVRIHRLREHLGWTRERFDSLIVNLREDFSIQLHGGDPSSLSETEIKNSYMDEKGMLFITLTWRGKA